MAVLRCAVPKAPGGVGAPGCRRSRQNARWSRLRCLRLLVPFGRFEAFFLPAARWEQVREAFWARTGFPVDPDAAVEQLKARLSDAFDRFLEGVADNRQVAFDDDGWRLKTDAAEQPDLVQSDPPRRAAPLAGRPQPLDPARRPAHVGTDARRS